MGQFNQYPCIKGRTITSFETQRCFGSLTFQIQPIVIGLALGTAGIQYTKAEDQYSNAILPKITTTAQDTQESDPLLLNQVNSTASRLKLSARETPASVQTITQKQLQENGVRTVKEAFGSITGATVGNVPGNPAVLTLRGFSGNTNTVLQDGVRLGASTFTTRDLDVWKYEKVEVLKGPASVLYGEGALGGTVNLVTRKPTLERTSVEGLLSSGSFSTARAALDANAPISADVAIRGGVSYLTSGSLNDIDRNQSRKIGLYSGLLYQPNDALSMLIAINYDDDKDNSSYQGSPVLPTSAARQPSQILDNPYGVVIDKATRYKNYNPEGAHLSAGTTNISWQTDYVLNPEWSISNIATFYHADREFFLAPEQTYTRSGLFNRTVERWDHDHTVWSNRLSASYDSLVADRFRQRFSLGTEYSHTHFESARPSGNLSAVDPFDPVVGSMPGADWSGWTSNFDFTTRINNWALFAENAINLNPKWLVVGGVRYETLDVDRESKNQITSTSQFFSPSFRPFSWRLGSVYDINDHVQVYGQYSTAVTPVSSLLVISTANGEFNLSKGKSAEIGFKSSSFDQKLALIGSIYHIELDDILTRDPNNVNLTVQGGKQKSKGAEITASYAITPQLRSNLGASWVDAQYKKLIESGGADRSGNRPINVPDRVINASMLYTFKSQPITLGGFVKHASGFYTDTANTYFVKGHTTYDASLSYALKNITLTLWGRNLTNEFYGEYSGYSSTQIYIGAPRSVELAMTFKY